MNPKKPITILLAFLLLFGCAGCGMQERSGAVFDSGLYLSVRYEGASANAAFKDMQREAERLEKLINRTNPDTVLSVFNRAKAGETVELTDEVYAMLRDAERLFAATNGMFDISLGGINALFHTDIAGLAGEKPNSLPDENAVAQVLAETGMGGGHYTLTETESGGTLTKLTDGFTLDLNGYVKGYAAQRMVELAQTRGAKGCIVNLGGDIATLASGTVFKIGIVNPDRTGEAYLCAFEKPSGIAVATSGGYERFYTYDYVDASVELSHLSSGVTGLPAGVRYNPSTNRYENLPSRVVSATVLGENAADADAYATALCAADAAALVGHMQAYLQAGYESVVFTADGRMLTAGAFVFDGNHQAYVAYERTAV